MTKPRPYPVKALNTYIPKELMEYLDELAKREGTTRTRQLEQAICLYLAERFEDTELESTVKGAVKQYYKVR